MWITRPFRGTRKPGRPRQRPPRRETRSRRADADPADLESSVRQRGSGRAREVERSQLGLRQRPLAQADPDLEGALGVSALDQGQRDEHVGRRPTRQRTGRMLAQEALAQLDRAVVLSSSIVVPDLDHVSERLK